jgi:signal peptidase II
VQERGAVSPLALTGVRARRVLLMTAVAAAAVALDQFTKSLAVRELADGPVDLVWTLRLSLSFNHGAAFGMGRGSTPIVLALGVVMLVVLVGFGRHVVERSAGAVAMGLLLGGALGNIVDRLVRDNGGAVIDFIDFQWWPIFNVADIAITCGAVLLVWATRERAEVPA